MFQLFSRSGKDDLLLLRAALLVAIALKTVIQGIRFEDCRHLDLRVLLSGRSLLLHQDPEGLSKRRCLILTDRWLSEFYQEGMS
jgi:hypothetical protein